MRFRLLRLVRLALPAAIVFALCLPQARANDVPPRLVGPEPAAPKIATAPRLESAQLTTVPGPAVKLTPAADVVYAAPKDAAVSVTAGNAGGSGVVVWSEGGKSYIVTNKHVIADASAYTVRHNATGKNYPAKFVDWSQEGDVAILEIGVELTPARLGADAAPGDNVTHYGNTTGPQSGKVAYFQSMTAPRVGWSGKNMHAEYVSDSGDSGAGVYTAAGELVAVHWGGRISAWPSSSAPVSVVRRLLARVAENRCPRLAARLAERDAARAGVVFAPSPQAPALPAAPPPKLTEPKAADDGPKMYQVGNGPWLTAAEFRLQYPHLAGAMTGAGSAGVASPRSVFLTAPGSCPGGRCPVAR